MILLQLIIVNPLSCASRTIYSHTLVAPHGCIDIGGALLNFFKNVQNDILGQN
jgi:hypothetical protein